MIQVSPEEWEIIRSVLKKYPYQFYVFGSRVKDKARRFSDLDLLTKDDIPDSIMTKIRGEFEDSNLPYKVDIILDKRCSADFHKSIESDLQPLIFDQS